MRFYLFFLFFYFPIVCFSDYEIKSKNFSFTKDNLFLKDTIELNSMFGKITSFQAGLYKSANKLFLDGMVNVSLKEGGQIASTSAFLDMFNKKAQFFSKNNKQANFDINSRTKLNLASDEIEYDLNNDLLLSFTKNVVASIDNDIRCLGGKAYLKNTPSSHIELYPEESLNFCSFSNKNSKFLAKKAQIEIEDKDLAMQDAKGSYFLPFMKGQDVTFSSKKLFFNIKDNELILEEDVIISKSGIGDIKSNEVKIFQDDNKHHANCSDKRSINHELFQ